MASHREKIVIAYKSKKNSHAIRIILTHFIHSIISLSGFLHNLLQSSTRCNQRTCRPLTKIDSNFEQIKVNRSQLNSPIKLSQICIFIVFKREKNRFFCRMQNMTCIVCCSRQQNRRLTVRIRMLRLFALWSCVSSRLSIAFNGLAHAHVRALVSSKHV